MGPGYHGQIHFDQVGDYLKGGYNCTFMVWQPSTYQTFVKCYLKKAECICFQSHARADVEVSTFLKDWIALPCIFQQSTWWHVWQSEDDKTSLMPLFFFLNQSHHVVKIKHLSWPENKSERMTRMWQRCDQINTSHTEAWDGQLTRVYVVVSIGRLIHLTLTD